MLRPGGYDLFGDQALEYYHKHTAQIEVGIHSLAKEIQIIFW